MQKITTFHICAIFLGLSLSGCGSKDLPEPQLTPISSVVTSTPTAPNQSPISLYINGARLLVDTPAYLEDEIIYIPGQEVFDALGYLTYIITDNGIHYIGGMKYTQDEKWTKFHIEFGSKDGIIDPGLSSQTTITFDAPAKYENGKAMLPLKFVDSNPGIAVSFNPINRRIDIKSGKRNHDFNLQKGTNFDAVIFKHLRSDQLSDNRIADLANGLSMVDFIWESKGNSDFLSLHDHVNCGTKRWNLTINNIDWEPDNWDVSEINIDSRYRPFYEKLNQQGILLSYNLIFKDKDFIHSGGSLGYPRFKKEAEIQRYLDYVRSTSRYFKGLIEYYEIWNEPNIQGRGQYIEPNDYINLVKRTIPVIREEDPNAKISVGQTTQFDDPESREYTYALIKSDLMPIVDAISLHTLFWNSPEHESEFYYNYPDLLRDVKQTAWAHGFKGEFIGSEGNYSPNLSEDMIGRVPKYSNFQAGFYASRGNVTNLGLGFSGGYFGLSSGDGPAFNMICNLNTIFVGAQPAEIAVEIESSAEKTMSYGFILPNNDVLIAIWNDGIITGYETEETANLRVEGFPDFKVQAIDILNNFEQMISSTTEQGFLKIENLVIKDYPIILKLSPER